MQKKITLTGEEIIYKPSSVIDVHLSRRIVASAFERLSDRQATDSHCLLHRVGFTLLPESPRGR